MPNRLIHEDSPYLQQHAHNPVDWWPWCDEAFDKAIEEDQPIFLSIGYSSCHWCHVMEHEVFEDEKIAAYLNAHFVSIKVDREERPDIDKHYQSVHQLLNQRPGGWPLSIFMTPDRKPFFAGTYIPPVRRYNMMGFLELIEVIDQKWRIERTNIVKNADEIQRFLAPKEGPVKATKLQKSLAETFIRQAKDSFDHHYGGFSKAPKFPHTSTLDLLIELSALTKDEETMAMAVETLDAMSLGGLYDVVDGGFCRYSTDEAWWVPHFEKMTYDNALLARTYLMAYHRTGIQRYRTIAMETIAFMQEKMSENHLFFSASDADSDGAEGRYFVYDYDEVVDALKNNGYDDERIRTICQTLSITPEGRFEGQNIVRFLSPERPDWWVDVRKILRNIRKDRTYPFIDRKIITSWNAMMIEALFLAAWQQKDRLPEAIASLQSLLDLMWPSETKLYHSTLSGKKPTIKGFLEDYAYLARALVAAYRSTLDRSWLSRAQKIVEQALTHFYKGGEWYFSVGEFRTEGEITDTSYPSSAAVMVDTLLDLGALIDPRYTQIAFKSLEFVSYQVARHPLYHPTFTRAALRYLFEDILLKSSPEALQKAKGLLAASSYPWILPKIDEIEGYQLCGRQSCFAHVDSVEDLPAALDRLGER